jgi:hypothetical protein
MRPYSGLMFAFRMTLAHFSVSSAINFPNSAGELEGNATPPRSTSRALMAESESARSQMQKLSSVGKFHDATSRNTSEKEKRSTRAILASHKSRCRFCPEFLAGQILVKIMPPAGGAEGC